MEYLNDESLLYLILIGIFLIIFIWNNRRSRKNREHIKNRNFRRRYEQRKKDRKE